MRIAAGTDAVILYGGRFNGTFTFELYNQLRTNKEIVPGEDGIRLFKPPYSSNSRMLIELQNMLQLTDDTFNAYTILWKGKFDGPWWILMVTNDKILP